MLPPERSDDLLPVFKGHAGHLAADRFGGSPELDNLVSQSSNVNQSKYKRLENKWAKAISEKKKVAVNVKINYDGNNPRPKSFDIKYSIDGNLKKVTLEN
ncbi:DNA/RNA non-specific endonuclease [Bacillus paralicheniformis]|uniref:DNA/RNA non-specific endonuclease n=1 Tax=Bacillus paralicheniformis TaxID=1648923 RepID=UPI00228036C5|nr:DNA/RNA non-specific endonuclease [Bacillus paralicheniformis]MCY8179937.1 DNA/RNA non-specific endonuclease [Bacillus paralicheniformis]MED1716182.1 DNA/RNA non-specific endonuclease [Bacillus paralicheniformis]